MYRETQNAAVHGVAKSQTQLSDRTELTPLERNTSDGIKRSELLFSQLKESTHFFLSICQCFLFY